jgi:hypothetical protein
VLSHFHLVLCFCSSMGFCCWAVRFSFALFLALHVRYLTALKLLCSLLQRPEGTLAQVTASLLTNLL